MIKDYADGKLLYCHPPPGCADAVVFAAETVVTALRQTKRLRQKLLKQQLAAQVQRGKNAQRASKRAAAGGDAIDEDLLQLIAAAAPDVMRGMTVTSEGDPLRHHHRAKNKTGQTSKWGKKDRKNRNKDPYGCHSTPDVSLYEAAAAAGGAVGAATGGVIVNAGKSTAKRGTRDQRPFPS